MWSSRASAGTLVLRASEAAIVADETLTDMAGYWHEALAEERRDIVWALLNLSGLIYDLERRAIVGLLPRPDMLPVMALGLSARWEHRGDGLWLQEIHRGELRPSMPLAQWEDAA